MEEKIVKPITNNLSQQQAPQIKVEISQPPVQQSIKSESPKEVVGDMTVPSDPYYTDPLFYEVANYFGLQQEDYASAKYKLSDIVDYVIKEAKSNKPEDVLVYLRKIEETIMRPGWDEKRYTNVHKYIRLAAKKQSIQQAMTAYERKGAIDYGN